MHNKSTVSRGGKRINAGRKLGSGKFGEPTTLIRVPESHKNVIVDFLDHYQDNKKNQAQDEIFLFEFPALITKKMALPLFSSKVRAGLPDIADEHVEKRLDVSEYLIAHADTTFFATIVGDSMRDAGLLSGDKAVVDRSRQARIGDIVLAFIDGEFTIKTLGKNKQGMPRLIPANIDFSVIEITENMQFEIWGVVTGSFRRFK